MIGSPKFSGSDHEEGIERPYFVEGIKLWGDYYKAQYNKESLGYNGYNWHMAHYWEPIAIQHFKITATDQEGYSDSPVYQNPYWSLRPDTPAEK